MKKRLILDVQEKFHANIKAQAAHEGKSIKQLVIDAVAAYIMQRQANKENY